VTVETPLFDLATMLVLLLAFVSAAAAAGAAVRALPEGLRRRHPDLVARLWSEPGRQRSPAILRVWRLALAVVSREVAARLPAPSGTEAGGRAAEREDSGFLENLARDLSRAGEGREETPEGFLARALVEGVCVAAGLTLFFLLTLGRPLLLLALASGAFHTLILRPQTLRSRARERAGKILRRLPYAMDLMILVVEAGGTLDEALETIAAERDDDPLADELALALAEAAAGGGRTRALRRMAERLDLDELTSLVIAIERAEATGAPIAETLATQAEVVQRRRMQRAERMAVQAPIKMMFPNMLIMIAVLLIILGPIFVQLVTQDLF
jgi:tight adherence protein C